jgi:hypothetical protein
MMSILRVLHRRRIGLGSLISLGIVGLWLADGKNPQSRRFLELLRSDFPTYGLSIACFCIINEIMIWLFVPPIATGAPVPTAGQAPRASSIQGLAERRAQRPRTSRSGREFGPRMCKKILAWASRFTSLLMYLFYLVIGLILWFGPGVLVLRPMDPSVTWWWRYDLVGLVVGLFGTLIALLLLYWTKVRPVASAPRAPDADPRGSPGLWDRELDG